MTGCVADSEDLDPEFDLEPEYQTMGGIGTATISTTTSMVEDDCLNDSGVLSALRTLSQGPIANPAFRMPLMPNMPAPDSTSLPLCRRNILKAVTQCALSGVHSYVNPNNGSTVVLPGALIVDASDLFTSSGWTMPALYFGMMGLAPDWMTRGLTTDEQERVSACVMARTNHSGATINVLLEGRAPLDHDPALRSQYPYFESTVWGNIFASTPSMHVCHNAENAFCIDPTNDICGLGKTCGFTDHGDCKTVIDKCTDRNCVSNKISVFLKPSSLTSTCPEPITP